MTKICYELSTRYTWTLFSSQEQKHKFENILSRSGGDNRDNQAQAKGESSLRNYLNAEGFYITLCGHPECPLQHILLLSRLTLRKYSNKDEHYNTSHSHRPVLFSPR